MSCHVKSCQVKFQVGREREKEREKGKEDKIPTLWVGGSSSLRSCWGGCFFFLPQNKYRRGKGKGKGKGERERSTLLIKGIVYMVCTCLLTCLLAYLLAYLLKIALDRSNIVSSIQERTEKP